MVKDLKSRKKDAKPIKAIFVDVGGVLLNNGWDTAARLHSAKHFKLDVKEMESRHHLTFDTYEIGKITLDEYLNRVVFYEKRSFTHKQFIDFMHAQSVAFPQMIDLVASLKKRYGLKVAILSNEGRELTEYRMKKFKLDHFIDFYIASGFVGFRKPDKDIYRIALDVAQIAPEDIVYIEDREMFIQVAEEFKVHALHHTDYESTCKKLATLGLK